MNKHKIHRSVTINFKGRDEIVLLSYFHARILFLLSNGDLSYVIAVKQKISVEWTSRSFAALRKKFHTPSLIGLVILCNTHGLNIWIEEEEV